jgi:hypothetical protein
MQDDELERSQPRLSVMFDGLTWSAWRSGTFVGQASTINEAWALAERAEQAAARPIPKAEPSLISRPEPEPISRPVHPRVRKKYRPRRA